MANQADTTSEAPRRWFRPNRRWILFYVVVIALDIVLALEGRDMLRLISFQGVSS